tara:strand:+ start:3289 stop:3960 length:672 start_codon:yes stop_codon:yes gene_type:complete
VQSNLKYNIFIGLDEPNEIAFKKCKSSIIKQNTRYSISIHAINYNTINEYNRVKDKYESTQFAFARFFVPFLSNYKSVSIFCDSDFLFLNSIDNLIDLYDPTFAIQCCKHQYTPKSTVKMSNKRQSIYPRKNWSSLIIFNNEHPKNKTLNPLTINNQSGAFLHRFKWLEDNEIGDIPIEWNWLVGYYKEKDYFKPKALHFTDGGPWLKEYKGCEFSKVWLDYE